MACVGFVGLDALSIDMAALLLRSGYIVKAFEIGGSLLDEFLKLGGSQCSSPLEAGKEVAALIVLISHTDQINDLFFGSEGVCKGLSEQTVVILHSTISSSHIQKLEKNLADGKISFVVDAYVSWATSEHLNRKIMVSSSGQSDALSKAQPILSAMSDQLYIFNGEIGAASKVKLVNDLLEGIHLVASAEAISLGCKAGIHPLIIYDIISNAAGNSWVFKNHVPHLLSGKHTKQNFLDPIIKNLATVADVAKAQIFPVPLLSVAYQQLVLASAHSDGSNSNTTLLKIWERVFGVDIQAAVSAEPYKPEELAKQVISKSAPVKHIGFIGLGAMGFGMATNLLKSNFSVTGFDVYKPSLDRFATAGGLVGNTPAEVSKNAEVLIIMVTNESQAESVLYGDSGAVSALPHGASIILSSTVSPMFVAQLERRLISEGKNLKLVDAPVSGGVKRAADGTLTIMAAGSDEALSSTGLVLSAMSEKLYIIKGSCAAGSGVKMVNQLLAGVHIASSAEAMAFGARLGLNTRLLFDVIINSGGGSWMFENRVPHMLDNDFTPYSALDIFVKDLGIVSRECSFHKIPLHIATVAHQLFLTGSAAGWGRLDDAGVVKVYETLTGVKVEAKPPVLRKDEIFQSLPAEWQVDPIDDIRKLNENSSKTLIVLDDDPTGTQTVHDIEVLTEWTVESLKNQFKKRPKCLFILTNSRALGSDKATELTKEICRNILTAAEVEKIKYTVVLRGDSTLRGHFPQEADAAVSVLGEMDAWIICPFFLQGGRFTINDIHYVADGDSLVPAGETEFAKDAAFGYKSSNLREWVEEKTGGRVPSSTVASISIQLLRSGGPDAVCEKLCSLKKGSTCIINAASDRDMAVFAAGMIKAELKGKNFLCRTAASFVSARVGIIPIPPILPKDLGIEKETNGGLIVVGSYVPKTTKQVQELKLQCGHFLKCIEVSVEKVAMKSEEERDEEIERAAEMADVFLRTRKDTLVMTSRELITGKSPSESLDINFRVSSSLVEIVRRIKTKPRYILAKGGITSSDLATKALEAKCAKIAGQALAGVPLWQLGPESRHPGVPYIVFPGNVGSNTAVAEVVKSWALPVTTPSAKDLLLNAEKGGYAVGAFNVYNLEGVQAVIAAAEEEHSPAILQIHPAAFKQGGDPLVATCISAAAKAKVPIIVHFDHGASKQDLVEAIDSGFHSVMADGSHLSFEDNISYTKFISRLAHSKGLLVEAELGRLAGTEDDLTVEEYEAKLTDVHQAKEFIDRTGIDALAVCIGNVHGKYPENGLNLRLDLLKDLHDLAMKKGVFLVLHGASGVPQECIEDCIKRGVRKFNVNTEIRKAYMECLAEPKKDIVYLMESAKEAMKVVIAKKMQLFGSSGKA